MRYIRSKIWRAILGIAILLLPIFGAYGLFVVSSSIPDLPHLEFPSNILTTNPLKAFKWLAAFFSNPAPTAAFAGAWLKLLVDPLAEFFETGNQSLRLRQFFGTIFFAILFTALSFIQIRKDAAKIVAEATGMSPGALVFLGYFCAAYAAMTALLDLSRLANALIKKTV